MKTIMWMQLFENKTVFQQHIETIKKQMCGNDRECEVHWSTSPWRGNNRLIRAALAHQSNASERTHNMTVQMVLCKSKTRGSLIREPDSRKQTMSFGHAIYPCRQGAVGGWYRHSRPSSGSIGWCWWTDRWAVRHSAIFLSYFLPQPLIWVRRLAWKGHWLSPDIQIRSAASTKGCAKHFFFFTNVFQLYEVFLFCQWIYRDMNKSPPFRSFACSKEMWNTSLCFDIIKGTHTSLIPRPDWSKY